LNVPTVLGPLGGGDIIPIALRKSFPWRYWLAELLRDFHNLLLRIDPIVRAAFRHSRIIFLRTDAAMAAVPPRDRGKVYVYVGLGVADAATAEPRPRQSGEPLRLLYAGGLLYLKGIHLGLRALAHARARGTEAILTIVGDGPARADLERLTLELGLTPHVTFRGHVTRDRVLQMYREHHVMLFPSLRDAGGMVVLEAWGQSLPVICFGLGGPGKMVDETCGRVVAVTNRSEAECAAALGEEIAALASNEKMRLSLAGAALARHQNFSWRQIASSLYREIEARLQPRASGGSHATRLPDFQQGVASKQRSMSAAQGAVQGAAHE
jgi:glycosyltransferase involved in cell wall biosynthesis